MQVFVASSLKLFYGNIGDIFDGQFQQGDLFDLLGQVDWNFSNKRQED